jgi:phosphatidylcholine synthase
VLVPAYAMHRAGLLPESVSLTATMLILITSALYFADVRMKTGDWYFRGFPAVWNLFAFLAFVYTPPPWPLAALVAVFVVLTFAPVLFVHPMRVQRFRLLSLAMLGASGVFCVLALWWDLEPPFVIKLGLGVTALYFLAIGLVRRA